MKKQDQVRHRSHDQNTKFRKFKIADGRHFENLFSLYFSRESSDFNELLYADANFGSNNNHVTKYQNFANPIWRPAAILKIVFGVYLNDLLTD